MGEDTGGKGNWKVRVLLLGGLAGALTGLAAAYLLVRRAEDRGVEPRLDRKSVV